MAQTQSSREVEIRARVDGFLDKRLYTEGELVKAGQGDVPDRPQALRGGAPVGAGQLAQQQAGWEVAKASLARVRPLAEQNAVSKKDLDDAVGAEQRARRRGPGQDGGYTTIGSPLTGLSSFAKKEKGSPGLAVRDHALPVGLGDKGDAQAGRLPRGRWDQGPISSLEARG